jgi:hypothetical protein
LSRRRLGRSALALALALLAALAAIGALAWFVVRSTPPSKLERAEKPRITPPTDTQVVVSTDAAPLEARSTAKGEPGATSGAASAAAGTGTLRLRVLDEKTRAPVPDLNFIAYRERGGRKGLGNAKTDARGCAELREVEANTVVVRTERRPPYAEGTGAVWIEPGSTKDLELLLGPGGAFVGRVIDDLGQPIEGAEIRVAHEDKAPEPDSRSGPDGRFRVDCLASRPQSVWIVDGALRPESWEPTWVDASLGPTRAGKSAIPVPGQDLDVGDLVLPRGTTYSGRLFDASDRLVDGALIGYQFRTSGPADPDFVLAPGEVLTSGGGRFELSGVPVLLRLVAWTREGLHQEFPVPLGEAGGRVDGLELHLRPELTLELEFVDEKGAPATIPAAVQFDHSASTPWGIDRLRDGELASAIARSSDGARERAACKACDADGKWRLRLAIDPAKVGELKILAAGYASIVEHSDGGFPALVARRIVLEKYPIFHVRLVPKDPDAKLLPAPGVGVGVQICMADPAHHAKANGQCCGLGSSIAVQWRGEPVEVLLPVRRKAEFWIYARGPRPSAGTCDYSSIGPFAPGDQELVLTLDTALLPPPGEAVARNPPAPSSPGEKHVANVTGHVVDARTGQVLARATASFAEVVAQGEPPRTADVHADERGELHGEGVPPGRWNVSVSSVGYKNLALGERTALDNETLDLGALALEPYPVHRLRVHGPTGKSLDRVWVGMIVRDPGIDGGNRGAVPDPDGTFRFYGDLPPNFVLQVLTPEMYQGRGAAVERFVLQPWPEDEIKELRMVPARKVVVTIAGLEPDESALTPFVCPAPGEPTSTCDHHAPVPRIHESLARGFDIDSSSQGQRYAFLLGPGRFQVYGSNLMHELPWTEFEVTPGDTDLELTIPAH